MRVSQPAEISPRNNLVSFVIGNQGNRSDLPVRALRQKPILKPMLMPGSPWHTLDDRALCDCINQGMSKVKISEFLCRDIAEIERRTAELGLKDRRAIDVAYA